MSKTKKKKKVKAVKKRPKRSGTTLERKKVTAAYELYCNNKSVHAISKALNISRSTIARYRDRENWDDRKAEIDKKAIRRVDAQVVKSHTRQVNLARQLQATGLKRFMAMDKVIDSIPDEKGKSLAILSMVSTKDARELIKDGITLEREIEGVGSREIQITIKMPTGYEDI